MHHPIVWSSYLKCVVCNKIFERKKVKKEENIAPTSRTGPESRSEKAEASFF